MKAQHHYPWKMRSESVTGPAIKRGGKVSGFISSKISFTMAATGLSWGKNRAKKKSKFGYSFEDGKETLGIDSARFEFVCPGKFSESTCELRS